MLSLNATGNRPGFGDPAGYGKRPIAPGIQDMAYSEAYPRQKAAEQQAQAASKQKAGVPEPRTLSTTGTCEVNPKDFPVLRTHNRYSFVMDYIDGWHKERICWFIFIFWMAAGIFTFTVFPAGSLIMFALAARFRAIAAGLRWGMWTFGVKRTLMVVD
jgi:hypothetical protein